MEISARFADQGENLENKGYKRVSSEKGDVYFPVNGLNYRDTVTLGLTKFLWMPKITVDGVSA